MGMMQEESWRVRNVLLEAHLVETIQPHFKTFPQKRV